MKLPILKVTTDDTQRVFDLKSEKLNLLDVQNGEYVLVKIESLNDLIAVEEFAEELKNKQYEKIRFYTSLGLIENYQRFNNHVYSITEKGIEAVKTLLLSTMQAVIPNVLACGSGVLKITNNYK